jgi:N utilization substance protein B
LKPAERRAGRKERKSVLRPRTTSRLAAVQALYQMHMTDKPASLIVEEFVAHRLTELEDTTSFGLADEELFRELTLGAAKEREAVDAIIADTLVEGWSIDRLESTLLAILRVGAHELLNHGSTPTAVVISEYVDVTHAFYDEAAVGLVNGVLDRVAQVVRERDGTDDDDEDEDFAPRTDRTG